MTTLPFKISGMIVLSISTCFAEFEVANGAVQIETTASGVYDSNIRSSSADTADYYLTFDPSARFRRLGGRFTTEASAGVIFKRFLDHTEFNGEDAHARFNWEMTRDEGETTGATLALGYVESSDAVVEVNDQVRAKSFYANNSGEVLVAGRHLLSAGLSYRDNEHDIGSDQTSVSGRVGYSYVGIPDGTTISTFYSYQRNRTADTISGNRIIDQTADSASVAVSHPLYGDLVVAATYGYRWLNRGAMEALLGLPDRSGSYFDLTLKGPFLPKQYFPKTTGTFRLAYEQADTPGLNDGKKRNRLVGQVNVSWAARERTTLSVFASRAQELSINDLTVVNFSTGVRVTQGFGSFLTTNLSLRYTNADFADNLRTDDRYETEFSAIYQVNRAWSAEASYRYLDSKSNTAFADYNRHIVVLTIHYVL